MTGTATRSALALKMHGPLSEMASRGRSEEASLHVGSPLKLKEGNSSVLQQGNNSHHRMPGKRRYSLSPNLATAPPHPSLKILISGHVPMESAWAGVRVGPSAQPSLIRSQCLIEQKNNGVPSKGYRSRSRGRPVDERSADHHGSLHPA